jgi:shikimate dehydrogenase
LDPQEIEAPPVSLRLFRLPGETKDLQAMALNFSPRDTVGDHGLMVNRTNQDRPFENQTRVFCILSDGRVFRSKLPEMFTILMKRVGMNAVYVPFRVEPDFIGQALTSLRVLNIAGATVSVPYKERVIPYLDALSEGANFIGAINTIVRKGQVLKGYNTNAIGFMDALTRIGFEVSGKSALVFGSGAAAKAVVFVLNWLRARTIFVSARNDEKTKQVVGGIGGEARPLNALEKQSFTVDIVVNATSVSGMDESPELAAIAAKLDLPGCQLVFDLNYGRVGNFWQQMAAARGIRFLDGLLPLACQARRSFALWTGLQVEPGEFLKALKETAAMDTAID